MINSADTIVAIATAPGRGGIGIIRLSGNNAKEIGEKIFKQSLKPRYAHYGPFYEFNSENILDEGICIFFNGPNSFTGEDVVEIQGHGGPIILDLLLKTCLQLGARLAKPGEFSERAFLNDKLDLTQAEAIADLINSSSEAAARSALHSLQGKFSDEINTLNQKIIELRIFVEASIDFPEEEIDFISEGNVANKLQFLIEQIQLIKNKAKQGSLLRDGISIVLAGKPNAGKSSLLNALAGKETAIVTDIAGTTRDVVREHIHIDGLPLHIIDTAGLRETEDLVEKEGVRRAQDAIETADHVLLIIDSFNETNPFDLAITSLGSISDHKKTTIVFNKTDLSNFSLNEDQIKNIDAYCVFISAKTTDGLDNLKNHIKEMVGYQQNQEGQFIARRRHIDAINRAEDFLLEGQQQLQGMGAGELLAEDLRRCHETLGEITGKMTSDELLGEIFSSFCIGK